MMTNPDKISSEPEGRVRVDCIPPVSDITLLDVREQSEWDSGHAVGAIHIPLAELPSRFGELDLDKDLYVICRSGGRAERAVAFLENVGIEAVVVSGGMIDWEHQGLPTTSSSNS